MGTWEGVLFWTVAVLAFYFGSKWGRSRERARLEYEAQMKLWREADR